MIKPIDLIKFLRESDFYIEMIFTEGSCYKFHLFLKKIYPESKPFINKSLNHVITKIGKSYFDITGKVSSKGYSQLLKEHLPIVENWSFHRNKLIQIKECPVCEEPICV